LRIKRQGIELVMNGLLNGKSCLVTGGGSGIGKATASRLLEEGADHVWIIGRNANALSSAQQELGERCQFKCCDVTDKDAVERVLSDIPSLDILVSNAAVSYPVDPLSDSLDKWRHMLEINLWGSVNACRAAGDRMIRDGKGGRIVMISSIHSTLAEPGSAPYGVSKAALNQLAKQLAVEWAPHHILVNVVAPGFVLTPMSYADGTNEIESDWCQQHFLNPQRPRIPLMRPGQPDEIAEAAVFFANPRNTYCTGSVLVVDGGLTVKF